LRTLYKQKRLTTNEVLRKELNYVTKKVEFLDKYLNLADVVQDETDAKKVLDFFE